MQAIKEDVGALATYDGPHHEAQAQLLDLTKLLVDQVASCRPSCRVAESLLKSNLYWPNTQVMTGLKISK